MLPDEMQTLRDAVRWAASRFEQAGLFYGHGTDNAIDEAAALVLQALHLPPDLDGMYFSARLSADEKARISDWLQQRITDRRPLPYITGEAWFAGLAFRVDERVLVPRSPLAELIEAGFEPWLDPDAIEHIADVGTGCGCIAVACAYAFPQALVDALDNSEGALELTRANSADHGVASRVTSVASNLLSAVAPEPAYDLIVANPPYVASERLDAMPAEFRHEPREGLDGGGDGLALIHSLLEQAAERLFDDGILVCEVGHSWPAFEQAYPELPVTWVAFERGGAGVFVIAGRDLHDHLLNNG
jgi:ribosomal protein L3 glutamine methyltransferase